MARIWYKIDDTIFEDTKDVQIYLKGKMTKGEYLYGERIKGLGSMGYEDAFKLKLNLSRKLVKRLLRVDWRYRDDSRVLASIHSQKHNEELLNEMYENDKLN